MSLPARVVLATLALVAAVATLDVRADPKTVCTITVNSPDEKDLLRKSLPETEFRFVELVERGRPDWLASACRAGVRCDVLVISGHFDGGTEFYTDRLDQREYLPVDEMERVSCSDACPGLFSELREVYLFGCNTLNADAARSASAEIARSLVRSGHSPADAERLSALLEERYAESNRDRMRNVFKGVPVIYGFSSKAPLGPFAASTLNRFLQSGGDREIGSGRLSPKLVALFAPSAMTVASGATDADPHAAFRADVCRFADDRTSAAQKIAFLHDFLHREMAEVRFFLDHIEKYLASLSAVDRQTPALARALGEIAGDRATRTRFLEFARDADLPAVRVRMLDVAHDLGWLTAAELHAEYARMIGERVAVPALRAADVELLCSLSERLSSDAGLAQLRGSAAAGRNDVAHAAIRGCLGGPEDHARVLRALAGASEDEAEIVQVYLRHRPIADAAELRMVMVEIARMGAAAAQARALQTLVAYRFADRDSLDELTRLFPRAKSVSVQRAIAAILIRADLERIANPALVRTLRESRLKSPDGRDVIDVLIRRMESAAS